MLGARRGYGSDNLALAVRSNAGGGRHRAFVGRLVRIQRRLGTGRRLARGDGDRIATHLAAGAGAPSGGARVVDARQTVRAWYDLGRGRGTWYDHARVGFRDAVAGNCIGIIAGGVCFWACTVVKLKVGYDDSLEVFGVHGIGGYRHAARRCIRRRRAFCHSGNAEWRSGPARRQSAAGGHAGLRHQVSP